MGDLLQLRPSPAEVAFRSMAAEFIESEVGPYLDAVKSLMDAADELPDDDAALGHRAREILQAHATALVDGALRSRR